MEERKTMKNAEWILEMIRDRDAKSDAERDAINAGIAALRAKPEWISVTDRLPELIPCNAGTAYSEAVFIITKNRIVAVAVFDGYQNWIFPRDFWECDDDDYVTHWMPFPGLPEGDR